MRMRGIPEEIVGYVGRRLACRKTQLIFDDFVSEEFVVDAGLDQGDPFSPTGYLLYNSDHLAIADPKKRTLSTTNHVAPQIGPQKKVPWHIHRSASSTPV